MNLSRFALLLLAVPLARPTWLADERLWYRASTVEGSAFKVVNPERGTT